MLRKRTLLLTLIGLLLVIPPILVQTSSKQIKDIHTVDTHNIAIVFGAGIVGDHPSDVLNDRLETAAELYRKEKIDHILVSGDNRFENYSEPDVMQDTLINTYGIPIEAIVQDFAGRRTYDTCVRANQLWSIEKAILVTQEFHLPRAIWTCEKLGIESVGVSATLQDYKDNERNMIRELLASYKAFSDMYIWTPTYVGGEPEEL